MSETPVDEDATEHLAEMTPPAPAMASPESADAALVTELALARARRALQVADSHAPATRTAYDADWRAFRAWCERLVAVDPSLVALPASDDTLSTYIGALDARAPSSVRRAVAAIRLAHERAGYPALLEERPATVAALRGHARRHARTPKKQQTAATDERLRAMVDICDTTTLVGLRNRALLLVGTDTGLRRSELVGIDIEHLERAPTGTVIRLPVAKTDQTGEGARVALLARIGSPYCPVSALERWLEARDAPASGPVFVGLRRSRHCRAPGEQRLSDRAVARIVKAAAQAAGLPGDWAGHSLRRGMISAALDAGVAPHRVQRHARHRDLGSTLAYHEAGTALAAHPRAASPGGLERDGQDAERNARAEDALHGVPAAAAAALLAPSEPAANAVADSAVRILRWLADSARPPRPTFEPQRVPRTGWIAFPALATLAAWRDDSSLGWRLTKGLSGSDRDPGLRSRNTINAIVERLGNTVPEILPEPDSDLMRRLFRPLSEPADGWSRVHRVIAATRPGSHDALALLIGMWVASARLGHPPSYLRPVLETLVAEDGALVRGECALERTVHAARLLAPNEESPVLAGLDARARHRWRIVDVTLYLLAAQHAELGQRVQMAGYRGTELDPIYRPPYDPGGFPERYFAVLRDVAGHSRWAAMRLSTARRGADGECGSRRQLNAWKTRTGPQRMTPASLRKLLEHTEGFDPARRELDQAYFYEGYRVMGRAQVVLASLDAEEEDADDVRRTALLERYGHYLEGHRAALERDAPSAAGASGR